MNSHFITIFVKTTLENMKEISIQEYHKMRNEAWDMMVKTKMVEDKDSEWLEFDDAYYEYLLWEQGYTIAH